MAAPNRKPSGPRRGDSGRPNAKPGGKPGGPSRPRSSGGDGTLWLFGLHAVRDALKNPRRSKRRLILTPNALQRLEDAVAEAGLEPEIGDPRRFPAPIDPSSVHQGAALECEPLDWGSLEEVCAPRSETDAPRVLLLDRVTDPHNVGAVLRSSAVFGARAVIAPHRHAAPETGALAKAASGALERQPYLRIGNLAQAMKTLQGLGYVLIGLDGDAELPLDKATEAAEDAPLGLALGAEGAGLRQLTKESCDALARIPGQASGDASDMADEEAAAFLSLNVSNAAAIALYASRLRKCADGG